MRLLGNRAVSKVTFPDPTTAHEKASHCLGCPTAILTKTAFCTEPGADKSKICKAEGIVHSLFTNPASALGAGALDPKFPPASAQENSRKNSRF
jgi:hypothetical protein